MLCSFTVYKDIPYFSRSMISMAKSNPHMYAVASYMPLALWIVAMNTACLVFGLLRISIRKGVG